MKDVSFSLHKGEILGIAGLVGSGRTELVEALFGARALQGGSILIHDVPVHIRNTFQGKRCSIGLITEDRKETGLALHYHVSDNIVISNLRRVSNKGFYRNAIAQEEVTKLVKSLNIRTPSNKQKVVNLSGGKSTKSCHS